MPTPESNPHRNGRYPDLAKPQGTTTATTTDSPSEKSQQRSSDAVIARRIPGARAVPPKHVRMWTYRDEKGIDIHVAAELETIAGKTVRLKKWKGVGVTVEISALSEEDLRFLENVTGGEVGKGGVRGSGESERRSSVGREELERERRRRWVGRWVKEGKFGGE